MREQEEGPPTDGVNMSETPAISERLTRCETMLQIALENQEDGKDRHHKIGNQLQEVNGRLQSMGRTLDETVQALNRIASLENRVATLEDTHDRVNTVWQVIKWAGAVTMGFATLSMAVGDKIAKLFNFGG